MERDIDDLLDEVETKFVKSTVSSKPTSNACIGSDKQSNPLKARGKSGPKGSSVLDEAIDDILDIDVVDKGNTNDSTVSYNVRTSVSDESCKSDQTRRCFPVFVGGSSQTMGVGSTVNTRACDQLRCTSCDFRVCTFDNLAWSKDTDYLFLRNNVPDFQKLKSKLTRKKGCRAYCCQCSWRNILETSELKDGSLKWVCGKHNS